jgi:hypothetical protein
MGNAFGSFCVSQRGAVAVAFPSARTSARAFSNLILPQKARHFQGFK